uniref:Candidate secreted effector n=1 Tax=Meloidogyne incognita TaxID=6306 RepID=A0A914KNN3_MELIC
MTCFCLEEMHNLQHLLQDVSKKGDFRKKRCSRMWMSSEKSRLAVADAEENKNDDSKVRNIIYSKNNN